MNLVPERKRERVSEHEHQKKTQSIIGELFRFKRMQHPRLLADDSEYHVSPNQCLECAPLKRMLN